MLPIYFIMTIKTTYPKITLAIAFTLSTSIGSRTIYTFSNDFSVIRRTFSNDFYHPLQINAEEVLQRKSFGTDYEGTLIWLSIISRKTNF